MNKEVNFNRFKQVDYSFENLDLLINEKILEAESFFFYRRFSHILEESPLIEWLKNCNVIEYNKILIKFSIFNKVEEVTAVNHENIYFIDFKNIDKNIFIEKFKISIRDIKNILGNTTKEFFKKSIYVDDPIYDQYDFIFTTNNNVLLWTQIHEFLYFVKKN